jgi:hypothetical protein
MNGMVSMIKSYLAIYPLPQPHYEMKIHPEDGYSKKKEITGTHTI